MFDCHRLRVHNVDINSELLPLLSFTALEDAVSLLGVPVAIYHPDTDLPVSLPRQRLAECFPTVCGYL
jgi:hypothetical protein